MKNSPQSKLLWAALILAGTWAIGSIATHRGETINAIWFVVLFILTTLDAGTRAGRFMLQDLGGHFWKGFGNVSSYPMRVLSSFIFVAAWGYFLWQGVTDPKGGIRFL
jgi:carbon starvation protein CstA